MPAAIQSRAEKVSSSSSFGSPSGSGSPSRAKRPVRRDESSSEANISNSRAQLAIGVWRPIAKATWCVLLSTLLCKLTAYDVASNYVPRMLMGIPCSLTTYDAQPFSAGSVNHLFNPALPPFGIPRHLLRVLSPSLYVHQYARSHGNLTDNNIPRIPTLVSKPSMCVNAFH